MKHFSSSAVAVLLLALSLSVFRVGAQTLKLAPSSEPSQPCSSAEDRRRMLDNNPKLAERIRANEAYLQTLQDAVAEPAARPVEPPTYYIPVVFHIIGNNYSGNVANVTITTAQVQAQLDVLNRDFSALNADLSKIAGTGFESRVGNARIQFCLAKRTATGATQYIDRTTGLSGPVTGIEYITTSTSDYLADLSPCASQGRNPRTVLPAGTEWATDRFLNIWVCALDPTVGIIGYGTFPGMSSVASGNDGVVIHTGVFGTAASGRAPLLRGYTTGRILTHEVGHWLNLYHVWGDDYGDCSTDDLVTDTPQQADATTNNPIGAYNSIYPLTTACGNTITIQKAGWGIGNTCPCDAGSCATPYSCNNIGDMYMNFMDYTNERCQYMFSAGQVIRMRGTFEPNLYGNRLALLSSLGGVPTQLSLASNLVGNTLCAGNQRNYQFRAVLSGGGCGGPAPTYTWTVPPGWTIRNQGIDLPGIVPDGVTGGTVSVTVSYTDGVNTVTLPPASLTINVVPNSNSPIMFVNGGDMCLGQSQTLDVSSDPNAVGGYLWTIPSGFSPEGSIITSGPSLTITAPSNLAAGTYNVTCQSIVVPNINKNDGCPTSPVATLSFQALGPPTAQIVDVDPQQRDSQGIVCTGRRIAVHLQSSTYLNNIYWSTTSYGALAGGQGTTDAEVTTGPNDGISFTITATFQDAQGCSGTAVYSASTQPPNSNSILSNGYDCTSAPVRPYPNPADKTVTLAGFRGACVLYNSQGQPVARYAGGTLGNQLVDTQSLPNGFYAVVGQDARGLPVRYLIQVQH